MTAKETVTIRGITYKFKDITKEEYDKWNSKYRIEYVYQQAYSLACSLMEIEKKFENGEITEEIYLRQVKTKKYLVDELKNKYFTSKDSNSPTLESIAVAEKISMSLAEPKLKQEEILSLPYETFNALYFAVEDFHNRDLVMDDNQVLEKVLQMLSEYPKEEIKVSEVLDMIRNVKDKLTLKKNLSLL